MVGTLPLALILATPPPAATPAAPTAAPATAAPPAGPAPPPAAPTYYGVPNSYESQKFESTRKGDGTGKITAGAVLFGISIPARIPLTLWRYGEGGVGSGVLSWLSASVGLAVYIPGGALLGAGSRERGAWHAWDGLHDEPHWDRRAERMRGAGWPVFALGIVVHAAGFMSNAILWLEAENDEYRTLRITLAETGYYAGSIMTTTGLSLGLYGSRFRRERQLRARWSLLPGGVRVDF